jgi:hypothetical protein
MNSCHLITLGIIAGSLLFVAIGMPQEFPEDYTLVERVWLLLSSTFVLLAVGIVFVMLIVAIILIICIIYNEVEKIFINKKD